MKQLCCFLIMLMGLVAQAENKTQPKLDSLFLVVANHSGDTIAFHALHEIGRIYTYKNADSSIKYATLALQLATRLGKLPEQAKALSTLGVGYKFKGNYAGALEKYGLALQLFTQLHDSAGIARIYNNIGNVNSIQKNYKEALQNYFLALGIRKQMADTNGLGATLGNIGLMYFRQEQYDQALQYYTAAKALLAHNGDRTTLAMVTDNIGDILAEHKDYKGAEQHFKDALVVRLAIDEPSLIAASYNSLGRLYNSMGRYAEAAKYGLEANTIAHQAAMLKVIKESADILSNAYEHLGNPAQSKKYYVEFIAARDSMFNLETEKKIAEQQIQFEYEKKEALSKAEQLKKDAITAEQLKYREAVITASFVAMGLLLVIAGITAWAFRQKRRDNKVIQQLVNDQEQVIAERTQELEASYATLEASNKQLVELVQYNAHEVREPLTRITGLMEIMDGISQDEFNEAILPMLAEAAHDLDTSIRKVVQLAEERKAP